MPHDYCPEAVQREIERHNRASRRGRIGRREARAIHALLKGSVGWIEARP